MPRGPHIDPRVEVSLRRRARDGGWDEAFAPTRVEEIWSAVQACRRCDLWRAATQGVAGEGPARARLMLVGEQPGDREDQEGRPFVGPAGRLLDAALGEAGLERTQVYLTNAVKHFKHDRRGKRRLHRAPDAGQIDACRWWLDHERRLVKPRVIVAMGASAGRAVFGRTVAVNRLRGRAAEARGGVALVTFHPAYLLRIPDEAAAARARALFVADLAEAARLARAD